jgi:hypothetical protein
MKKLLLLMICTIFGCVQSHHDSTSQTNPTAPVALSVIDDKSEKHPWTNLNFNNDPNQFQFAIVGDRTGRHRDGVFEKGIDKLNLLRPEFVMSVGDLIEGYTKDEAEIDQEWDEIQSFTAKLQAPFFYVPGNHDQSNSIQAKKWHERFGPAYYHFVYRDVLFLCLNTNDPVQHLSPEQIAYVAKALKENSKVRWTCVFMHEPLWDYKQETGWDQIEKLLLDRPYTVFAGHYHTYTKYVRHDRRYIVLATTGGGMKNGLMSPELGSFDHITWVTMLPDGPRLANIELDAIHDEDVRTEATAKLIDRVLRGEALHISPLLSSSDSFGGGEVKLTFINESEVPMRAQGNVPEQSGLRFSPEQFDVTVESKKEETVTLRVATTSPIAKLSPASVKWSATYLPPGRHPVKVPREDWIAVEKIQPCPAVTSAVVIDGKLNEWPELPLSNAAKSPSDCFCKFGVEHDDKYVYIAAEVVDDKSILNPKKEPWSQDGIEVRFDARAEPVRSQGRGHGEFKDILVVSMSPGVTPDQMVLYSGDELPAGVKAICVKTEDGFNAEIAIPVSYLNEKQGGKWSQFRMNIAVDDYDDAAGPLKALWWRPDWRSPATFAGSGTFARK